MKRTIITVAALVALGFAGPAGAASNNEHAKAAAAKQCAAEKKADRDAFEATYGPKHAMRNCIKATTPEAKNAAKECKAEREADPVAFQETYGTNENGRNALGKCVSQKLDDGEEESA